jgi:hypothetical protein
MAWRTPFLSVLSGTDKDALQRIFVSLQEELARMEQEIAALKMQALKPNKYGEQSR